MLKRDIVIKYIVEHRSNDQYNDFDTMLSEIPDLSKQDINDALIHWDKLKYLIAPKTSTNDVKLVFLLSEAMTYVDYLNDQQKKDKQSSKDKKRLERNQWIQFWIPIVLSIIAIVISALALLKQ